MGTRVRATENNSLEMSLRGWLSAFKWPGVGGGLAGNSAHMTLTCESVNDSSISLALSWSCDPKNPPAMATVNRVSACTPTGEPVLTNTLTIIISTSKRSYQ